LRLAGVVNIAGSLPSGAPLSRFGGVKVKSGIKFTKVGSARTRKGKYVFNRRLPKKVTYFFVERPPTVAQCASPLAPCTAAGAVVSNAISKVVRVVPARKR